MKQLYESADQLRSQIHVKKNSIFLQIQFQS